MDKYKFSKQNKKYDNIHEIYVMEQIKAPWPLYTTTTYKYLRWILWFFKFPTPIQFFTREIVNLNVSRLYKYKCVCERERGGARDVCAREREKWEREIILLAPSRSSVSKLICFAFCVLTFTPISKSLQYSAVPEAYDP